MCIRDRYKFINIYAKVFVHKHDLILDIYKKVLYRRSCCLVEQPNILLGYYVKATRFLATQITYPTEPGSTEQKEEKS